LRVDVVIPTRNRWPLLQAAIASVRGQTNIDARAIVVDDASTDETAQRVPEAGDNVTLIQLERHSERSQARNTGLAAAGADYVLFLDDDDLLRPGALARLARGLEHRRDASVAIGARRVFDDRGHRRRARHVRVEMTRPLWPELLGGWFAVPGQCLFRTAAVRDVGGWSDTVAGEDQELLLRIARTGPAVFVPATVLDYRVHPGQWRAFDAADVEEETHAEFVATLDGADLTLARRLRAAHAIVTHEAIPAYHGRRYSGAVRAYVRAVRQAPLLARSPLLAPHTAGVLAKSALGTVLGRPGERLARRLTGRVRVFARRNPGNQKTLSRTSARRK
jgi:glycosyltransferase involved in cell wall biosynthesis